MECAIVKSSELGTDCWFPQRFTGGKCKRVDECTYPVKKTCKAHIKTSAHKWVFANGHDNGIEYHI